jgi:hypothetical protein
MWLLIALALLGKPEVCTSTIFGMEGDRLAGKRARLLRRPVDPAVDMGIAHRSLPMGSLVVVEIPAKGTWAFAVVIDRGPYGRVRPKGSPCPETGHLLSDGRCWVNGAHAYRKCRKAGKNPHSQSCYYKGSKWRGGVDATPALARALNHDGWERVRVRAVKGVYFSRIELLSMWGWGNA